MDQSTSCHLKLVSGHIKFKCGEKVMNATNGIV